VNITGVTALVRATAVLMRINGSQYPAEKLINILLNADYTHVSNEVSFSPFCPVQEYTSENLLFCSPENTFDLLEYIDVDIIELTGDHISDYGPDPFLYTLNLYEESGISYYGGGETLNDAQKVLKIEHHGNKFAFLGCNAKNPSYSKASENYPGTWHCDLDKLKQMILLLQVDGYTPIVTIQHLENELNIPPDQLIEDFSILSELKPIVLIGSQAHVSKPFEIEQDIFIHYGLGNLFFDQINESEAHGEAFIDRLIFYENRLLNIELFPIKFLDYAQSRPMTQEEEVTFLTKIFELSNFTHPQ
jgi:poly-gamma-glutamate synthesis protein (capsule biosynthesis protein)